MSKKLAAKASLIQMPPVQVPRVSEAPVPEPSEPRVKTAPGSMAHFMASQSAAMKEAEELRERLKQFDGAKPVRALDPAAVRPSRWANRHHHAYGDAAFAELKTEIASAGGNVQPVCVRAVAADAGGAGEGAAATEPAYELIFGHRRHRACLELGLPLQAMIIEASDRELFEAMERENRSRKNLSAWEQGAMYRRALDEGLYASQRKLAEALGVDVSLVSKSLSLARLPDAVVQAFPSPLEIQFRWAQPLAEALQRDPDGVVGRAQRLKGVQPPLTAAKVLDALLGRGDAGVLNRSTPSRRVVKGASGREAVLQRDAQGRVTVSFGPGMLSAEDEESLIQAVAQLLH